MLFPQTLEFHSSKKVFNCFDISKLRHIVLVSFSSFLLNGSFSNGTLYTIIFEERAMTILHDRGTSLQTFENKSIWKPWYS